jgi:hypothetical protein
MHSAFALRPEWQPCGECALQGLGLQPAQLALGLEHQRPAVPCERLTGATLTPASRMASKTSGRSVAGPTGRASCARAAW